jgi:carbonic anhydrase
MDARLHPERFLGLDIGDAHVVRNVGGRASEDAVRSLIISSKLLGTTEFVVIHHTVCGFAHLHQSGAAREAHRGDGGQKRTRSTGSVGSRSGTYLGP